MSETTDASPSFWGRWFLYCIITTFLHRTHTNSIPVAVLAQNSSVVASVRHLTRDCIAPYLLQLRRRLPKAANPNAQYEKPDCLSKNRRWPGN